MIELPVHQKSPCDRSGGCCRTILLTASPRQVRVNVNNGSAEAALIEDMLGECRGVLHYQDRDYRRYVYGPCKNLTTEVVDGREVAGCAVHDNKPQMCREYPRHGDLYDRSRTGDNGVLIPAALNLNPGYMKGCGFNIDPDHGYTTEEYDALLWLLEDQEKADYAPPPVIEAKPKRKRAPKKNLVTA